jgi:hypothetical protein
MYIAVILIIVFYNSLLFFLERVVNNIVGLFIPILGYLLVLIVGSSTISDQEPFSIGTILQFLFPDFTMHQNEPRFYIGPYLLLSFAVFYFQAAIKTIQKQDSLR